jgi:hypothetical protein
MLESISLKDSTWPECLSQALLKLFLVLNFLRKGRVDDTSYIIVVCVPEDQGNLALTLL